jgi:hypothetical protein
VIQSSLPRVQFVLICEKHWMLSVARIFCAFRDVNSLAENPRPPILFLTNLREPLGVAILFFEVLSPVIADAVIVGFPPCRIPTHLTLP